MPVIRISTVDRKAPPQRRRIGEIFGFKDGPSKRGSTYYKALLSCPREFGLRYEAGLEPEFPTEQLTTGGLHHYCLERHFLAVKDYQSRCGPNASREDFIWGGWKNGMARAYDVITTIEEELGYKDTAEKLDRIVGSWFERYRGRDPWRIIAVEETVEYLGRIEYTTRLDLVVEDMSAQLFQPVEFKTASSITQDLLENYQMDLQVLGQVWLTNTCLDLSQYPPFEKLLVDITTTKHKTPQHERVEVLPSQFHLQAFVQSISDGQAVREYAKQLGWPQAFGHCSGYSRGYGRCQFYSLCHGHPTTSVADWAQQDPPLEFVRRGEQT